MYNDILSEFASYGHTRLQTEDEQLHHLLTQEYYRQQETLSLIAAASIADPSVLACEGTATNNVTTEGYPGARFHAGCEVIDEIERLAVERAKVAFRAHYANVQPHSGSSANQIVLFSVLKPGDTLLGLDLHAGGHLTHGSKASISGRYFQAIGYSLTPDGFIDYEQVEALAWQHKPRLIICGASAYPRTIDFKRFRAIADSVNAYLLADISHIAGLVAAGEHPSPIDEAHFTTTSTYKQLYGPRGGLILLGKDHTALAPDGKHTIADMIQRAVFPFVQGTPSMHSIAAKARALAHVVTPEFRELARRIVSNARELARELMARGYRVLTGGTENHLVLVDMRANGMSGLVAEKALEECGILINKNRIFGDTRSAQVTSGIRLGTNSVALRGMGAEEMKECIALFHRVLSALEVQDDRHYTLDPELRKTVQDDVKALCRRFPIPHYPLVPEAMPEQQKRARLL